MPFVVRFSHIHSCWKKISPSSFFDDFETSRKTEDENVSFNRNTKRSDAGGFCKKPLKSFNI